MEKRIEYIDIAKCLGMIAVVWGHIMTTGWSFVLAYAFDIPLFFFLSGMMFRKEKYTSLALLIKNRWKSLLLPYLIFSVGTWLIWCGYNLLTHQKVDFWSPLLQTVIAQGSGGYLVHNVPLWFVTCLFLVEVFYYFICKLPKWANLAVCIGMAVIGHFMLHNSLSFDFTKLPWNLEAAMSAMLFYCLGNLFSSKMDLRTFPERCKARPGICAAIWAGTTALFVVGALFNGHITLGSNQLGKSTTLMYVVGLLGIVSSLLFSIALATWKNKIVRAKGEQTFFLIPWKGMFYVGRNSFYYMAVHVPIKGFLIVLLARLIGRTSMEISEQLGLSAIVFAGTMFVSFVVVHIIVWLKNLLLRGKSKT